MDDRPDLFLVAEAFLLGAIVPAGSLYATMVAPLPEFVASLGDTIVLGWIAVIVLAAVAVGVWRSLPTDALLGGGLLGTVCGWLVFSWTVGFDFVLLVLAFVGAMALVVGSWVAYEHRRSHGVVDEPPHGSWRSVFVIVFALLVAPIVLAVF